MTKTLDARKRSRACKIDQATGVRDCAAAKIGQPACCGDVCRGLQGPLVSPEILIQRECLTRHLLPRAEPVPCESDPETGRFKCCGRDPRWCGEHEACARVWMPAKIAYRSSHPRWCRKKCRAAVQCPLGNCFASFSTVSSEARLHEYAGIHGADKGAGNFWELAALALIRERPHPKQLHERDELASALRAGLKQDSGEPHVEALINESKVVTAPNFTVETIAPVRATE